MVALLFEGVSDKDFFDSILEEYNLPKENVSFFSFDGKDNIFQISHSNYDYLENDIDAGKITKALIVVDADNEKDPNPNRGYTPKLLDANWWLNSQFNLAKHLRKRAARNIPEERLTRDKPRRTVGSTP